MEGVKCIENKEKSTISSCNFMFILRIIQYEKKFQISSDSFFCICIASASVNPSPRLAFCV
ncbi:hypothetical protein E2C01_059068 [Portunus trituberculatus]|uniref:Uncharacterized protein n=1 Tax=Portunus trituberculatus TaxID=210409 RepID=A0A5B7H4U4_PORTR|nr:hypothetical protein [Portunus trituberculatus]